MNKRIRSLCAVTMFALALTSLPTTGLAAPIWAPVTSAPQPSVVNNPLRALLNATVQEAAALRSSLDAVYSDSYIATACDPTC